MLCHADSDAAAADADVDADNVKLTLLTMMLISMRLLLLLMLIRMLLPMLIRMLTMLMKVLMTMTMLQMMTYCAEADVQGGKARTSACQQEGCLGCQIGNAKYDIRYQKVAWDDHWSMTKLEGTNFVLRVSNSKMFFLSEF